LSFCARVLLGNIRRLFYLKNPGYWNAYLKRAHPIIDCVGHLSDTSGEKLLVFIQISLQWYSEHELSKLFHSWSGNPDSKSFEFIHYTNAFNVAYQCIYMCTCSACRICEPCPFVENINVVCLYQTAKLAHIKIR